MQQELDALNTLQSMGLELPSAAYIVGSIIFGLIGIVAWRIGRRGQRKPTQWIGAALMFYPYAISQTWLLYAVGCALCAGLWWDRA